MVYFGAKARDSKAQDRLAQASSTLLAGEVAWFFGTCNMIKPSAQLLLLTNARIAAIDRPTWRISFSATYPEIAFLAPDKGKLVVRLANGQSVTLKGVPNEDFKPILHYFNHGKATPSDAELVASASAVDWDAISVRGRMSSKERLAVEMLRHRAERPVFVLAPRGAVGLLAAFDDRLAIVKTGAGTSFMAGSFGGERSSTFYYQDITGIEYNSGLLVSGVLEILTASYSGTANRDFWKGTTKSRNADSNDPFTLSNCLPMQKSEYQSFLNDINDLRARISAAKRPPTYSTPAVPLTPTTMASQNVDLATQLQRLADLRNAGALTEDEFAAAKARLLQTG